MNTKQKSGSCLGPLHFQAHDAFSTIDPDLTGCPEHLRITSVVNTQHYSNRDWKPRCPIGFPATGRCVGRLSDHSFDAFNFRPPASRNDRGLRLTRLPRQDEDLHISASENENLKATFSGALPSMDETGQKV